MYIHHQLDLFQFIRSQLHLNKFDLTGWLGAKAGQLGGSVGWVVRGGGVAAPSTRRPPPILWFSSGRTKEQCYAFGARLKPVAGQPSSKLDQTIGTRYNAKNVSVQGWAKGNVGQNNRDFNFKMRFKQFYIDFGNIFFPKFFENFKNINFRLFCHFFGQKSCFWPFSNFSRPKSKNTFLWTCPAFYFGHFKLLVRSVTWKMSQSCKLIGFTP